MSYSSNKVRIISLKEAEKINKENVAYFTLTDGTVLVKRDENEEQNYNMENEQPFPKYRKQFRDFRMDYNMNKINSEENQINKNNDEVYKIRNDDSNAYETKNNNFQENPDNINFVNKNKNFKKKFLNQENENDSHERGYSFDAKVYHTNENIYLNYPEKNNYMGNRIRSKNIEKENNIYYNINNNINEENQIQKEISRNNQNYNYIITNENENIQNNNQRLNNYNSYSQLKNNNNDNIHIRKKTFPLSNINDNYQNNKNYKIEFIEAIPVKLCDNYNTKVKNCTYPKPQFVELYLNPEIITSGIKLKKNNSFGNKPNIDYSNRYKNNFHILNNQLLNRYNNFDDLRQYNEQCYFKNEPLNSNIELEYREIPFEQRRDLKNSNKNNYMIHVSRGTGEYMRKYNNC